MRSTRALALILAALSAVTSNTVHAEPNLVVIVRHAERGTEPADDPALTPDGERRAAALTSALASANITSIITTQYRRTRDTAAPVAKALGIEPTVVRAERGEGAAHIRELAAAVHRQTGNVLVVGHSDTVSALVAALKGPALPRLCDTSFDPIFVLTASDPKHSFLQLRYGAPSATPAAGCL